MQSLKGYFLEIRPGPMVGMLIAVVVGSFFAYGVIAEFGNMGVYLVCVFLALYGAHLMDTYVDYYKRGIRSPTGSVFMDSNGLLSRNQLRYACLVTMVLFSVLSAYLILQYGLLLLVIMASGAFLGLAYSYFGLDRSVVFCAAGYGSGVVLAFLGGYVIQKGCLDLSITVFGVSLLLLLFGGKVLDDLPDVDHDRSIGKKTLPVVIGTSRALKLALVLLWSMIIVIILSALLGVIPSQLVYPTTATTPLYAYGSYMEFKDYRKGIKFIMVSFIVMLLLCLATLIIV